MLTSSDDQLFQAPRKFKSPGFGFRTFDGKFLTPTDDQSIAMSLSAEAEKRKERLLALKKRKRGADDIEEKLISPPPADDSAVSENDVEKDENGKAYTQVSKTSPNVYSLPLSGRNYDATTRTTKLGFTENPLARLPENFETVEEKAIDLAVEALEEADKANKNAGEVDLFALQPKKANWDLKRELEQKLERLKPKTDAAIARLVRERLLQEKKAGAQEAQEGDLSKMM